MSTAQRGTASHSPLKPRNHCKSRRNLCAWTVGCNFIVADGRVEAPRRLQHLRGCWNSLIFRLFCKCCPFELERHCVLFFHPCCACVPFFLFLHSLRPHCEGKNVEWDKKRSSISCSDLLLISSSLPLWLEMLKLMPELLSAKADFQLRQTVEYAVRRHIGEGGGGGDLFKGVVTSRQEKKIFPELILLESGLTAYRRSSACSRVQRVFRFGKLMSVQGDITSLNHKAPLWAGKTISKWNTLAPLASHHNLQSGYMAWPWWWGSCLYEGVQIPSIILEPNYIWKLWLPRAITMRERERERGEDGQLFEVVFFSVTTHSWLLCTTLDVLLFLFKGSLFGMKFNWK